MVQKVNKKGEIKMKVLVLNENKEGHFYSHWTNINGLIGILQDNKLYGSKELKNHLRDKIIVSTSREQGVPAWVKELKNIDFVRIVLDIEKLNYKYKIKSFEYSNDKNEKETARSKQKSEFEDSIVLGDAKYYADFHDIPIRLYFNGANKNIESIEDKDNGYKRLKFNNKDKTFEFNDSSYKIEFVSMESGRTGAIRIYNTENKKDSETASFFDIKDNEMANSDKAISNIKDAIVSVEIADILFKPEMKEARVYNTDIEENQAVTQYIKYILSTGLTDGLNSSSSQHTVTHSYKTLSSFLKFIKSELKSSKIKTYKTPKQWFWLDRYKMYKSNTPFIVRNSCNINDYPLFFFQYDTNKIITVASLNSKLAEKRMKDNILKYDSSAELSKIKLLKVNNPLLTKLFKNFNLKKPHSLSSDSLDSLYSFVIKNPDSLKDFNVPLLYQNKIVPFKSIIHSDKNEIVLSI